MSASEATKKTEDEGIRAIIEKEMATLRLWYGAEAVPVASEEALKEVDAGALKDKVVVITGGSKGFGKTYALRAAAYGAKVVIAARGQSGIDATVQEIEAAGGKASGLATDVSNWDSQVALFEHAVKTFGPIDVVVANAGLFLTEDFLQDKVDEKGLLAKPDMAVVEVDTVGTIYTAKLGIHYLRKNPSPSPSLKSLVILGSLTSYIASPGAALYMSSSHGRLGLARALALESQIHGLGINIGFVASAPVPTDIFGDLKGMVESIPHGALSDTVDAMLALSSTLALAGKVLATDTKGIFRLPMKQALPGEVVEK
ncbi:hypothetical protein JCM8097_006290 [Rhodosporidiobolus ruineniae]